MYNQERLVSQGGNKEGATMFYFQLPYLKSEEYLYNLGILPYKSITYLSDAISCN